MKKDKDYYDFHFFVCTNAKEKGSDCASMGGAEVFAELKSWSKDLKTSGKKIRINKAGCLNRCSEGVACVAYPNGKWLTETSMKEIDEIKCWILKKLEG